MTESAAARDYRPIDPPTRIRITPEDKAEAAFVGEDGLTFGDVLDAINPLNHIPIIGEFIQGESHISTAAQLAGGALFGGPIGLIASLANAIFTQATGHSVGGAVIAALGGEDASDTQLAAAESAAPTDSIETAMAEENIAETLATAARERGSVPTGPSVKLSGNTTMSADEQRRALLSLYGNSAPSAHRAYNQAQMRPYLQQVNHSQVL